jgi:hypothetical protein
VISTDRLLRSDLGRTLSIACDPLRVYSGTGCEIQLLHSSYPEPSDEFRASYCARLFDRIRPLQDRFDTLCQRVESGFERVPEAVGLAEIATAVEAEISKIRIDTK